MYARRETPDPQELAAWGLTPEDYAADEPEALGIWPENAAPLSIFLAMGTQWRMGPRGPIGLDYAALPAVLTLLRIKPKARRELFAALRVMEREALAAMSEGQPT